MKKIKKILLVFSLLVLFTASTVNASACTKEAAMQLGKIVYRESGADTLSVKEDNFLLIYIPRYKLISINSFWFNW